ncbi:MAG TPA: AI-2E family transporter YdiK [Candidatus Polarisedimenticolaceae bacterium]|nr:AI-2E family transporter YdiK [Candidatus Polarisedimenticolaceae bacterium]
MIPDQRDLTRIVLGILTILLLIVSSLWILRPFLLAVIWATTIVVATWPFMLRVQKRLWGKRGAAVVVMVVLMLAVFVLPLAAAISSIAAHTDQIVGFVSTLPEREIPPLPEWVRSLPLVGSRIADAWDRASVSGMKQLLAQLAPYSRQVASWLLARAGGLGAAFVQFALTVILAAVLYGNGETVASGLRRFGRRLGGERGENAIVLAGQTVRGVALGVVVTALVQTTLAALGLLLSGAPAKTLLAGVIFILCIAQLGPLPVLIPVVIWTFSAHGAGWGIAVLVWSAAVGLVDNFLKPILIKRGADLPLLLIFAGVIGGLIGFGVIGLFVGPVMLGVTYTLLSEWMSQAPSSAA